MDNVNKMSQGGGKQRDSNVEMLRIFAMLSVVAHHMINNSGISHLYDYSAPSLKMFWLVVVGMWGKTAINIFVLITGYFMCEGRLTARKLVKLYGQISFYAIIMYVIMGAAGYEHFSTKGWIATLAWPFVGVNKGFSCSFLWFYLLIPFYNILLGAMTKRQLFSLIGILLAMFTVSGTVFDNRAVFDFVGWYVTLYFIGSALRKYPFPWMSSNKVCVPAFGLSVASAIGFVGFVYIVATKIHRAFINPNHLTEDSHKLLALAIAIFALLVFKNLKLGCRKWINVIASTTFGVLLIHAANDSMRQWLWGDVMNIASWYNRPLGEIILLTLAVPIAVFAVCSLVDLARIRLIETPLMKKIK